MVGFESTLYVASEGDGAVEVCAAVLSQSINCPIEFPFNISLSTNDGSSGELHYTLLKYYTSAHFVVSSMDYGAHVFTLLMFDACQTKRCLEIAIMDDVIPENRESFSVTLERTPTLDSRITLHPASGEIQISENDGIKSVANA